VPEDLEHDSDVALLEQLYALVGDATEGEPVSEALLRERRKEAAREGPKDE
jgi:hypothetical protein